MNRTKNKQKAPKNVKQRQNGFFRALVLGFFTCAAVWVSLALVFALVMSKQEDSNSLGSVISPVIVIISLFVGGFVAGKADKSCALLTAVILGCAALGVCYGISSALDISKGMGQVMKTVVIAVMLVCPVLGGKMASREKRMNKVRRKRL